MFGRVLVMDLSKITLRDFMEMLDECHPIAEKIIKYRCDLSEKSFTDEELETPLSLIGEKFALKQHSILETAEKFNITEQMVVKAEKNLSRIYNRYYRKSNIHERVKRFLEDDE